MSEVYIRIADLRRLRYCTGGARILCSALGIEWRRVVAGDVTAAELDATGNHFAMKVAAEARKRVSDTVS